MRQINSLLFGTAGIPICVEGNTLDGIKGIKKLGLSAMELEFVHSVNISEQLAKDVKKTAQEQDVVLTCHAPYYINLNAVEKKKAEASMHRILLSARRLFQCGGWSVAFHPGFYFKDNPEKVYEAIKDRVKEIVKILKNEEIGIWVRPETTGRVTQFGSLKELCKLSQEVENVMPCIDFSHLHARANGKENTFDEFKAQLELVEKTLGKEGLKNIHAHVAGIAYGEKGEKNHLELEKSDFNYKDLIKSWKEFKCRGVIICESPNIEDDALLLQRTYKS
jgi:deoxyribonuclease-4